MSQLYAPPRNPDAVKAVIAALQDQFGRRLQAGTAICEQHGSTTTWIANQPPDAVVYPNATQEVQRIVHCCAQHGVPIIPFGAGTSLEGQVNAPAGGISVDFRDMNQVLAVNADDLDCRVQPGLQRMALNHYLRDTGLFFPVDPGADASLGGMASTRASGTNAVRYGTMKDAVIAVEAVLPNGEVMTSARRARKSATGYDLTRLMVGAEGTLGLITELTLRLHGIPEAVAAATCQFPDIEAASMAVIQAIQMGLPIARVELLDAQSVSAVNRYSDLSLPEDPLLLLEFHGSETSVAEQSQMFGQIAADNRGAAFEWTTRAEDRTRLWQARHDAYWAILALRPDARGIVTDVCVPVSALARCVSEAQAKADELGLMAPILGHVGDGNFHVIPLINLRDAKEVDRAKAYVGWLNELAIQHDGTCTGEHGIGQGKADYLVQELGAEAVTMMRAIKRAVDPNNIMNPGKIFDLGNQPPLRASPDWTDRKRMG